MNTMIKNRIEMIFEKEDIARMTIEDGSGKEVNITVDAHGMSCIGLRKYLNNLICVVHSNFKLVVIHGFNHGTALKDMLNSDFLNKHVKEKYVLPNNPGRTCMMIA